MIVSYVASQGLRMGLVVDLTKTDRFYDKRTLADYNIGHHKLQCEGCALPALLLDVLFVCECMVHTHTHCDCRFGEAPTPQQVEDFNRLATHFFEQHPMEVIGVHCTHGYNRTGFLIISYLVEVQDWSLEAAVAAFANVLYLTLLPQMMKLIITGTSPWHLQVTLSGRIGYTVQWWSDG